MKVGAYGIISSRLIRTDRNGTRYYEGMVTCPRCGGAGGAECWKYTGWTCYKCGGSGKVADAWCERTPEYEAKLEAKRIAKAEKQRAYEEAHAEEVHREKVTADVCKSQRSIGTCQLRHCRSCETCQHRFYCSLLTDALINIEEAKKVGVEVDQFMENLLAVDRTEPVTIETLDGEPCIEGKWFDNAWGSSTRCITKPNGEKVYTSATTDRGLAKYGLRNRQGA